MYHNRPLICYHRFLFDLLLVALMIFETWAMAIVYAVTGGGSSIANGASVLRVARIMRVLRTARMARLVRLMPELMRPGTSTICYHHLPSGFAKRHVKKCEERTCLACFTNKLAHLSCTYC